MGLDICVERICKKSECKDLYSYFRLIDDKGNYFNRNFPDWTRKFEETIVENWFDWNKYKEITGIDIDNCNWHGESYGEEGNFMQVYPKDKILPEYKDYENNYNEYKKILDSVLITIDLDKVPTYEKEIKILYHNEVGYQRKGLNTKFYEDYNQDKIGYFVWTKAELERYKQDYCNDPYEYVYPNGEKSGDIIYPKDDFQKNIINKFEEGKDTVIFDW